MRLSKIRHRDSGFTIIELLVVMGIIGILTAIGLPHFSSFQAQMSVSEDVRVTALTLGELRTEAIRLRTDIEIDFTTTGFNWDINDDETVDGTLTLNSGSDWVGGAPASITFNGLGLVRNLNSSTTYTINNNGQVLTFTLNSNGYIGL